VCEVVLAFRMRRFVARQRIHDHFLVLLAADNRNPPNGVRQGFETWFIGKHPGYDEAADAEELLL